MDNRQLFTVSYSLSCIEYEYSRKHLIRQEVRKEVYQQFRKAGASRERPIWTVIKENWSGTPILTFTANVGAGALRIHDIKKKSEKYASIK